MQNKFALYIIIQAIICILLNHNTSFVFATMGDSKTKQSDSCKITTDKLIVLDNEIKHNKEMLDNTILAYNRSSDSANKLITIIGVLSATYGLLIAIASVVIGYISIKSKKRRDEAINTLEDAKEYVQEQVLIFDKQIELKLNELNKKIDESIQIMLEQLSEDTEAAARQVNLGVEEVTNKISKSAEEIANKVKEIKDKDITKETDSKLESIDRKIKLFEEIGIPNDPKLLFTKAMLFKDKKQYLNALELLDKLVSIDPAYKNAYWNLGSIYYLLNEDDKSIYAYDKAIELEPSNSSAYNNKALCLIRQGKTSEALVCYDKAIELNNKIAAYYRNKAIAYDINDKNIDKIRNCYDKAIELQPNERNYYFEIGRKLTQLNKYDEAKQYYTVYTNLLKVIQCKDDVSEGDILSYFEGLIITEQYDEARITKGNISSKMTKLEYILVYKWLSGCLFYCEGNNNDGNNAMRDISESISTDSADTTHWNFGDIYPFIKHKLTDNVFNICDCVKKAIYNEISTSICITTIDSLSHE